MSSPQIYALPWLGSRFDAHRSGSAILTRPKGNTVEPEGLHLGHLKKDLLDALLNLPELSTQDAGRPYRDFRLFITEAAPGARAKYPADVIAQLRSLLPLMPPARWNTGRPWPLQKRQLSASPPTVP